MVLAAGFAAIYARLLRGSLLEVLGEDYIRTARAKGLARAARDAAPRRALGGHADRDRARPGHRHAARRGVLVEDVFDIPGVGRLNYDAIAHADFPIIQGTVLLAAMFIVVANIIVDIAYAYLDPRVRLR